MSDQKLQAALQEADKNFPKSLEKLSEFVRIPSISTKEENRQDCKKAANWLAEELRSLGLETNLYPGKWGEPGHDLILGSIDPEKTENPNAPTLLFYGHYDVQPVDPIELWESDPFEPTQRMREDGQEAIYGRGTSDDKGQLLTFIEACHAWIKVNGKLPVPIKFLSEGEEEVGGENLPFFLEAYKDELKADLVLVCDTMMPRKDLPAITASLRGLVGEEVVIHCANQDLHSGMFGNAAANPIHILSEALADLRDENGRVTLEGFYDNIRLPSEAEKKAWQSTLESENEILEKVGLSEPAGEKGFSCIEQLWARPTCEVNGIFGGYIDPGFKTVIPAKATARVSFRTVPGQNPIQIREAFRKHIRDHLPKDATAEFHPHGASPGWEFPKETPALQVALKALSDEWEKEAIAIGCGASIPVAEEAQNKLGLPALLVGFALSEDRIHSPNESYAIESYRKGIRAWVRVLDAFAQQTK
ncbi:peptidase m20 family protein [Lasius niger]|uniref:Peptidase m20 family protein n=1 Tax=Lasius niger TaxID=67767 RepID=A0A0J7N496_LASNI|nr:peptidase m20 family protein [Lasius niger]